VTTFTMGRWSLLHAPLVEGQERPETMLFDLETDPGQSRSLVTEQPQVAQTMHRKMLSFLAEHGAPEAELEARQEL
jgi:hypothetical protein